MRRASLFMSERLPKHLHDALTAARLAVSFVGSRSDEAYLNDLLVRSAVERQFEILGEACRRALDDSPDVRERVADAALAIAVRNRIIHGYDRVNHSIILDTVKRDLPLLIGQLELELRRYPPP
jgi:uncharacterized protein with HEPN domain